MKRGSNGIRWTVDWHGSGEPTVGHIVHRFTPTKQDAGFYRVTSVRQVTPRTRPLEPPYTGRYQCTAAYIGDKHDGIVNWILYDHPRAKQCAPRPLGRFSPLLPPTEET